ECVLEYGTGTGYGSSASCSPSPGSGSSAVGVSASVSGLVAGTTYHFRVSATNAGGTSVGADRSFRTVPSAPSVVTEPASSVGQGSATLNGSVNPNGGEVSECVLEYGTGTGYGSSASCSPSPGSGSSAVGVSASVSGLVAGTTYHFRVSATNAGGTSVGADRSFRTVPPPAPEFGRCTKVTRGTGKYENAGCTKLGGAKAYEWSPGIVKNHFTTKIKEAPTASLAVVKGSKFTCLGETRS